MAGQVDGVAASKLGRRVDEGGPSEAWLRCTGKV